jgi:hypothetical protein
MVFWAHGLTGLLAHPPILDGPSSKSIRQWNIIHNVFIVNYSSIYISLIPWSSNLV